MGRQWKGHLGDTEEHFWGMGETGEHFGAWEDRREEILERRGNFFRHGKTGARALGETGEHFGAWEDRGKDI